MGSLFFFSPFLPPPAFANLRALCLFPIFLSISSSQTSLPVSSVSDWEYRTCLLDCWCLFLSIPVSSGRLFQYLLVVSSNIISSSLVSYCLCLLVGHLFRLSLPVSSGCLFCSSLLFVSSCRLFQYHLFQYLPIWSLLVYLFWLAVTSGLSSLLVVSSSMVSSSIFWLTLPVSSLLVGRVFQLSLPVLSSGLPSLLAVSSGRLSLPVSSCLSLPVDRLFRSSLFLSIFLPIPVVLSSSFVSSGCLVYSSRTIFQFACLLVIS